MGSKRRDKNPEAEVAKSKMADLVFVCLIEQVKTLLGLTPTGKTGSLAGTVDGKGRKVVESKRIGRIAEQSTFEGPANIAEPGVDEGK